MYSKIGKAAIKLGKIVYKKGVKALSENFFGINDIGFFSAEGLDIDGADVGRIMDEAKECIANSVKNKFSRGDKT